MKTDFLYFFIFFQTPFENLAKAINFATRKKKCTATHSSKYWGTISDSLTCIQGVRLENL